MSESSAYINDLLEDDDDDDDDFDGDNDEKEEEALVKRESSKVSCLNKFLLATIAVE